VDPKTADIRVFPLPPPNANLNTATFDAQGTLWFTGQNGFYGRLNVTSGEMEVFRSLHGPGPYGISTTPSGEVYYASLAGSYVGHIDTQTGAVTELNPPTPNQGARRVWPDSQNRIWVSEWNAGQVARYDPASDQWREWPLPDSGRNQAYAVFVDELDQVWLSDWRVNAMVRFDPIAESFDVFPLTGSPANVRQILGRPGEIWGAESGVDQLVVLRH
jgi:virginiamycin B lyase